MPRLTSRVFTDLAIWMTGFGLLMGLAFPPFCLALGLPQESVLSPWFTAATIVAGLLVGAVNFALARLVVGRRIRLIADRMATVEGRLEEAVFSQDWSDCDTASCALPVDSGDEIGDASLAFNRLISTLSRSHEVETAMRSFSSVLAREFDLESLADSALQDLVRHVDASAGTILVVRDDRLEVLASHGLRGAEGLAENGHVRRVLRLGVTERLRVAPSELVVDSVLVGQAVREILVAPVTFKGTPLGVVVLAAVMSFAPDAEPLLDHFRADLGLAVNNALIHDRLERLAAVDPLTEAYNRRFGLARLREEFSRAVRAEGPLGILMVDIDHFKEVNDTYGHLAGDRVLRAVARTCRRVVREGDVLVRYGGEEFLVVLPGAGGSDIAQMAERIRHAVAETPVVDGDQRVVVTVSVGGSTYDQAVDSVDGLIAAADRALYEAKEGGRDRVVLA